MDIPTYRLRRLDEDLLGLGDQDIERVGESPSTCYLASGLRSYSLLQRNSEPDLDLQRGRSSISCHRRGIRPRGQASMESIVMLVESS